MRVLLCVVPQANHKKTFRVLPRGIDAMSFCTPLGRSSHWRLQITRAWELGPEFQIWQTSRIFLAVWPTIIFFYTFSFIDKSNRTVEATVYDFIVDNHSRCSILSFHLLYVHQEYISRAIYLECVYKSGVMRRIITIYISLRFNDRQPLYGNQP